VVLFAGSLASCGVPGTAVSGRLPATSLTQETAGASKSTWYETGFFIDWSGVTLVNELVNEMGGGGMHAVGPWEPFAQSTGSTTSCNASRATSVCARSSS
jgi:hypothetical protein